MIKYFLQTPNERLSLLIVFYVFYLFLGALVFDAVESPHEAKIIRNLNEYVKQFRLKHNACLTDDELNSFIRLVSSANDRGVSAVKNVSKEPNWSFGQAVFFSGTVLTTIGYGDVSPQTNLGKCFCILYAIVGIPATFLLLYAIIERLMYVTNIGLGLFTDNLQPVLSRAYERVFKNGKQLERPHIHVIFSFTCALFVFIFFYIIPAAIYTHIEDKWSFLDAFYYCFISMSTVGLGDYVPGDSENQPHRHLYKIVSIMYLILGVMVMVWLLEIFSQTPEFNFYKYITLSKDGILTSHQDTLHPAVAVSSISDYAGSSFFGELRGESGTFHQKPGDSYVPITSVSDENAPTSSTQGSLNNSAQNDDELILKRSTSSQNNYSSLNVTK